MLSATAPNRGACRKGAAGKSIPQRHRIAEFAAVVAKGQATGPGRQKATEQTEIRPEAGTKQTGQTAAAQAI